MKKEYEIIVHGKDGTELFRRTFDGDCAIAIIKAWYPPELNGWKRVLSVYSNLMEEKEK